MKSKFIIIALAWLSMACLKDRTFETPAPINPGDTLKKPGAVVINEISANTSPDWVELYNPGDSAFFMKKGEYFFSDSKTNTTKYELERDVTIPPKGYIIFECASGGTRTEADALFSNSFGLSSAGEEFVIIRQLPNGSRIFADSITFPGMDNSRSFARLPDGSSNWQLTGNPTRKAPNRL